MRQKTNLSGLSGYFRFPTISNDRVAFVVEDDLWMIESVTRHRLEAGFQFTPRRLTSGLSQVSHPVFSPPNGGTSKWIAFTASEDGQHEVYLMPASGGEARRLTFLGQCQVVGWKKQGSQESNDVILFSSSAETAFQAQRQIYTVSVKGGDWEKIPEAVSIQAAYSEKGSCALRRGQTLDPSFWKRYRGGTVGTIWVKQHKLNKYSRLFESHSVLKEANLAWPFWVNERLFFISDHKGNGNLFSCEPNGSDIEQHTFHDEFYVRTPHSDGTHIVYQCGGSLFFAELESRVRPKTSRSPTQQPQVTTDVPFEIFEIPIAYSGPKTQSRRKFAYGAEYYESLDLSSDARDFVLTARGRIYRMNPWDGPVTEIFDHEGERSRLATSIRSFSGKLERKIPDDGTVWIADVEFDNWQKKGNLETIAGHEVLRFKSSVSQSTTVSIELKGLGRITRLKASPAGRYLAATNHRNELILIDIFKAAADIVLRVEFEPISDFSWSPDGRYLAFDRSLSEKLSVIEILDIIERKIFRATTAVGRDQCPSFDPSGKYLYFLSYREFSPVMDTLQFDLGFPRGAKPYLITLQANERSPFSPLPNDPPLFQAHPPKKRSRKKEPKQPFLAPVRIDFAGIHERTQPFPVPEGRYLACAGLRGKALFLREPVSTYNPRAYLDPGPPIGKIEAWDFEKRRWDLFADAVDLLQTSHDGEWVLIGNYAELRLLKNNEEPDMSDQGFNRKTGRIDLTRVSIQVEPVKEWRQMFREAWRLQRDHFWNPKLMGVDWTNTFRKYFPLTELVTTRSELSDVIWEMQGDLGTSHAYEMGGDYRTPPSYQMGFLGTRLRWNAKQKAWQISHILKGDTWMPEATSPLRIPGVAVRPGDLLLEIDGRDLSKLSHPNEALVHRAGDELWLTIADQKKKNIRHIAVRTILSERNAIYRDWVEGNRNWVHENSKGKLGYIHIPDMGVEGYSEFHRSYLSEFDREGLIIDVRFNRGGFVSGLLLEKLARKRVGYLFSRWFGTTSYPREAPAGPMVALTNENAGSDGDIFSHCFKLFNLGPLIGKRTWGGVIGIWPRNQLVDDSFTTQPEFSHWFTDVGWKVENHGTDPNIEVEITPEHYAKNEDPQLATALKVALSEIKKKPGLKRPTLPKDRG